LQQNHLESQPRSNDNISDRYTVKNLKSRFSNFQEAKEFYGISAKGWSFQLSVVSVSYQLASSGGGTAFFMSRSETVPLQ